MSYAYICPVISKFCILTYVLHFIEHYIIVDTVAELIDRDRMLHNLFMLYNKEI